MGILTLLGVIVGVLGAFSAFFVFLGCRAAASRNHSASAAEPPVTDSSWKSSS